MRWRGASQSSESTCSTLCPQLPELPGDGNVGAVARVPVAPTSLIQMHQSDSPLALDQNERDLKGVFQMTSVRNLLR
jgi:hypothetical protein